MCTYLCTYLPPTHTHTHTHPNTHLIHTYTHIPPNPQNTLYVDVTLFCSDGSVPGTVSTPCDLASVQLAVFDQGVPALTDTYEASADFPLYCQTSKDAFTCRLPTTTPLPIYREYTVSLTTSFTGLSAPSLPDTFYNVSVVTSDFITPRVLSSLYSYPLGVSAPAVTQSVAEFVGQYASESDLATFTHNLGVPMPDNLTVVGPNNPNREGDEASLDVQCTLVFLVVVCAVCCVCVCVCMVVCICCCVC
jgi:hypothetical protein